MTSDPINSITWYDASELRANDWNPNRVMSPELRLLEMNLLSIGWVQPILASTSLLVIDGFHRWRLSQDSAKIRERWNGKVPVAVLDLPDDEAMALTVRMNRAKGSHIAVHMHALVARLLHEYAWSRDRVAEAIGASLKEVDVLSQEGVFAIKNIKNWAYSQAWYPAETGTRTQDEVAQ